MLKSRLRSAKKTKIEYDIYLYMHDASEENKTQMEKNLCNLIKKDQMHSLSEMPEINSRYRRFCEFSEFLQSEHQLKKTQYCTLMCINKHREKKITGDDIGAFMMFYFTDKIYEPKRINTPLSSLDIISAVKENNLVKVKEFHRNGYSLDTKDTENDNNTALMYAIELNYPEIAYYLIANGADMNIINRKQSSALQLASKHEKLYPILLKLLQYGAFNNDTYAHSAFDAAINSKNQKAIDLLLMNGSIQNENYGAYEKFQLDTRSLILKYWDKKKYRLSDFEKQSISVDYLCTNQKKKEHKGAASILLDIPIKCADKRQKKDKSFFIQLKSVPEAVDYYYRKKFNLVGTPYFRGVDMIYNKIWPMKKKSKKFRELSKLR